jgi:DNA helicase-2/ATP-dependent DNA helicase PcrA
MDYLSNVNYKTDIDYDLLLKDLTDEQLMGYIQKNFLVEGRLNKPFKNVYKFLKIVCNLSKIQPSNEQMVYILNNNKRVLCEACAGAGKTTMSYFRLIVFNAFYNIDSNKMLGLCYNKHAADSFDAGYNKIARQLNLALGASGHIGSKIRAYTIHAWCKVWVDEYKSKWRYNTLNLIDENDQQRIISSEITRFNSKLKKPFVITDSTILSFVQLYNYVNETLSINTPEKWYPHYPNLHMFTANDLIQIMNNVSKYKKLMKMLDFGDLLNHMYELVCDPKIMERIRNNYEFIIVDEWQDVTPAMSRIIELIMQGDESLGIPPYKDGYLTVIGDGDQAIYSFRGTDSDNCIKFRSLYGTYGLQDEVKITSMSINRRCKSKILEKARDVITSLSKRIQKPVNYLTEGGNVEVHTFNSEQQQAQKVVDILKKYQNEYYNTCVCYRSMSSSSYISMELLRQRIPFNVVRGVQPFEDIYTSSLDDILRLLENPKIPEYAIKVLYKVLPKGKFFGKEAINREVKEFIERKRQSNRNNFVEDKNFWEYNFTSGRQQQGFNEAMTVLRLASESCQHGKFMLVYMPAVIQLFKRYYFDNMLNTVYRGKISDEFIKYVEDYYCCNKSYQTFKKKLNEDKEYIRDNKNNGVYLTTMHGLKGLEFKNTIIIDLDDNKFPGVDLNEDGMTEEQLEEAESEARRLFYVAITRAKDNLHLLFHRTRPTRYIRYFIENENLAKVYNNCVDSPPFDVRRLYQ